MSSSFVAPDNTYLKDSPFWNSFNATIQANQANLLNPGSSPYGPYAASTIVGVYQGRDASGNPIQNPWASLQPGQFNAAGYGPTGGWAGQASPADPIFSTPAVHPLSTRGAPASYLPKPTQVGNPATPLPIGSITTPDWGGSPGMPGYLPPTTGVGGTPGGDASWVPGAGTTGRGHPGNSFSTPGEALSPTIPSFAPGGGGGRVPTPPVPTSAPSGNVPGLTGSVTPAGTPPGGGFTGPAGPVDPATGLPAGYFMSTSPGMSNPVASPTFQTYMGQRLAAFQSPFITPAAFAADIVGQTGSYGSDTPYAQFARDYAGNHPDDPEIAARGGVDAFIAYYNQPQFALSSFRPDLAKMSNGWGSGVAGSYKGLGDEGTRLLWQPGQQPAFDATPDQVRRAMLLNGVNPNGPQFASGMDTANANLSRLNGAAASGAKPIFTTNPSQITDLAQLVYQPGASGPAGTPGVHSLLRDGGVGYPTGDPNGFPSGGSAPTLSQIAQMLFGSGSLTPDQQLALNSGGVGYLQQMVASGGMPTAVSPAWNAASAAMQRNTNRNAADLAEQFNVSGNRFSNAFGTAATDFYNQNNLNQNALLAQMLQSSLENAAGRVSSGSQTLAGLSQAGLQQLSSQAFQGSQASQARQLQAALAMLGAGGSAASQLASQGAQGAGILNQGAIQGATSLYNTENQAMFAEIARQLQLQQMGMSGAVDLSRLWQSNLGLGSQLGGQQYGLSQDQLNRMYQEYLRQQPQYSPLLSMFNQNANAYPQLFGQQFQPSQLGSILGGLGGLLGAIPGLASALGPFFGSLFGGSVGSGGSFPPIFGGQYGQGPFIFNGVGVNNGFGGFGSNAATFLNF